MVKLKSFSRYLYLVFFFLFILLMELIGILKPVRRGFEKWLIIPLRQQVFDTVQITQKTSEEDILLKKQITELQNKIAFLEEENRQQKRLLSVPLPKDWPFLSAKVIGVEDETLIISLPENQVVKEGMVVINEETYLGRVFGVSPLQAKVRLPSFIDNKLVVGVVSAKDQALTARGLLTGNGEGKMRIEQILLSENINVNDLVVTSVFGKDLLVGIVSEVIEKKGEMFKSATVNRQFSPRLLQSVFIINK